jgi:hypothetical protein
VNDQGREKLVPPSTPTDQNFTAFDEDVSLAGPLPPRVLGSLSTTDDVEGVVIYTHGCSPRIRLNIDTATAMKALARCGFSVKPSPAVWKSLKDEGKTRRYTVRGSKWLNERPPLNRRLPLVGLNTRWKTRLYSLSVEIGQDQVHVDLQVIRHDDIRRFFEDVLALKTGDYTVTYYRVIERFLVLPPHEAFRFATALGADPSQGGGRLGRKRRLVWNFEIPITVRKRAKATAMLVVYRIERGATAAYKVEVRLRGQRRDRGQFDPADVLKLDQALLDLVTAHKLKPIAKPARWEPRTFTTAAEGGAFDLNVKRLPQAAWRGTKISKQLVQIVRKCNTPGVVKWVASTRDPGVFPPPARIRSASTSSSSSGSSSRGRRGRKSRWCAIEGKGFEVTRYIVMESHGTQESTITRSPVPRDPWNRISEDIRRSRLYLHEIILDHEQSPRQLLEALAGGTLGRVAVTGLCAVDAGGVPDLYQSVVEMAKKHPFEEDTETLVIVVDATATLAVAEAVVGNVESEVNDDGGFINLDAMFEPGPLMPTKSGMAEPDILSALFRATGAWLWDLFEGLRQLGEQTGLKVVVVTVDGRTEWGRGALRRGHFFTDARVRSSIGDAGRYYTHQRYLVETVVRTSFTKGHTTTTDEGGKSITHVFDARVEHEHDVGNIIAVKDEGVGLAGRLIHEVPARPSRRRWRRRTSS